MLDASDESLSSTPETNIKLYVNYLECKLKLETKPQNKCCTCFCYIKWRKFSVSLGGYSYFVWNMVNVIPKKRSGRN